MADLTKMVEEWFQASIPWRVKNDLYEVLKALAAEIEKLKAERKE